MKDQVVVITGASEGIGRALAKRSANAGARLVLAARNEARLAELAAECRAAGAAAVLVAPTDVTKHEACVRLIDKAAQAFGRIDWLINNAGMTMWAEFAATDDLELLKALLDVNLMSVVYCTHAALPYLGKSRGRIVTISSLAGIVGVPGHSFYGATKHAVNGFINSLRCEIAGLGVSCTVVAPDFVVTEIHDRGLTGAGERMGRRLDPRRFMSADRCAEIILTAGLARRRLVMTSLRGWLAVRCRDLVPGALLDKIISRRVRAMHLTSDGDAIGRKR